MNMPKGDDFKNMPRWMINLNKLINFSKNIPNIYIYLYFASFFIVSLTGIFLDNLILLIIGMIILLPVLIFGLLFLTFSFILTLNEMSTSQILSHIFRYIIMGVLFLFLGLQAWDAMGALYDPLLLMQMHLIGSNILYNIGSMIWGTLPEDFTLKFATGFFALYIPIMVLNSFMKYLIGKAK
ncbi:MAG: hypothetical protein ACJ0FR_06435 [Gammaproteobacteria bacterium]